MSFTGARLAPVNIPSSMFDTIRNFRDCGGHLARDGRTFRTRRLYRSAHFPDAGDDDLAALSQLGIETIVDLRRPGERRNHPCRRWPGFAATVIERDMPSGVVLAPHLAAFGNAGTSVSSARAAMMALYRELPFDPTVTGLYQDFFSALAKTDGAVLVHCSAGKDRTGLLVALTHRIAGVGFDDTLADYLATNNNTLIDDAVIEATRAIFGGERHEVSDDAIRTALSVAPEYLETAFFEIERRYGSCEVYLEKVIGLSPTMRETIVGSVLR